MSWFGTVVDALRRLDQLAHLERKHGALIEAAFDRLAKLEARDSVVVTEAKAAAATAASIAASLHVAELARRQGGLEERVKHLEEQAKSSGRAEDN